MHNDAHAQEEFRIRFDWGIHGARELSRIAASRSIFVVVDVLSFTTTVSVACDADIDVFPFRWRDDRAAQFAEEVDAVLAQQRSAGGISLSPSSIRRATGLSRLVLPSPNGSTITTALQDSGGTVVAASLRTAVAVGAWIAERLASDPGLRLTVIAAGEQWAGEALRPAVEDLWGAGATIANVLGRIDLPTSPEAGAAVAAFNAASENIAHNLGQCASGRELTRAGYAEDVTIAAESNSSGVVPVLESGRYCNVLR